MRTKDSYWVKLSERSTTFRTCSYCKQTKSGDEMKVARNKDMVRIRPVCLDCVNEARRRHVGLRAIEVFEPSKWRPVQYEWFDKHRVKFLRKRHKATHERIQAELYKITSAGFDIDKEGECERIDRFLEAL